MANGAPTNNWSRDSQIALASLAVAVVTLFATIFQGEIHDFLKLTLPSYAKWVVPATGLVALIVGIGFTARLPKEFPKSPLLFNQVLVLVVFIFVWSQAKTPAPLVLIGSSNTKYSLEKKVPDLPKLQPRWLDTGSGDAMSVIFHSFGDGSFTHLGDKREALLALASDGTGKLQQMIKSAADDEIQDNYWLSITIAKPPLAVIYRAPEADSGGKFLKINTSQSGNFDWVSCEDTIRLINEVDADSHSAIQLYTPEANTGTRDVFDSGCGKPNWPPKKELHHRGRISEYPKKGPFVALVSSPPDDYSQDELKKSNIQTAVVCKGACDRISPTTEHVIVVKVQREPNNKISITNETECRITKILTGEKSCDQIADIYGDDHIATVDLLKGQSVTEIPEYLQKR